MGAHSEITKEYISLIIHQYVSSFDISMDLALVVEIL